MKSINDLASDRRDYLPAMVAQQEILAETRSEGRVTIGLCQWSDDGSYRQNNRKLICKHYPTTMQA